MQQFFMIFLSAAVLLASSGLGMAQTVRLDVKALANGAPASRVPEIVRNGSRTEALAPKLRLEAAISTSSAAEFPATLEWYVIGRTTPEAQKSGRAPAAMVVMQSSKESVNLKSGAGVKTSFFAYGTGQVRDGAEGLGWFVRLTGGDGRLLDVRGSNAQFAALARDPARLAELVNSAATQGAGSKGEVQLPLELVARIKAEAEKNWPSNPQMQEFEIKNKLDHHKQAYGK